MNPNPRSSRALRRAVAVATTLAVSTAVVAVPVVPGVGVQEAAAQQAIQLQPELRSASVKKTGSDWEAAVFFEQPMTVRTVTFDYVPPSSTNPRKDSAPDGDPNLYKIPEVGTYRVDHFKASNIRTRAASYTVTVRKSLAKTPNEPPREVRNTIRLTYELSPGVKVEKGDRLSLVAEGKGSTYPLPFLGSSRFTNAWVTAESPTVRGKVQVHNPDGTPAGETQVRVFRDGAEVGKAPVDADGRYAIVTDGQPGKYTVQVVPPTGFATPREKTWTPGQELDFDVNPINVNGRVVDGNGAGVAGAKVTVGQRSAVSDQNGYFTVTKVPTGTYTVQIGETNRTQGTTIPNFTVRDQQINSVGNSVRVTAKQLDGRVSGKITDDVGRPVGDASVVFKRGKDTYRFGTKSDGSFYYASMKDGVWDVWIESKNGAFPDTHAGSFEVKANQRNQFNGKVELYRGSAAATVSGLVEPVEVVISGGPEKLDREPMGKVNGRYEKSNLLPGGYTVEVEAPDGYNSPATQPLQVVANDTRERSFTISRKTGTLSGQVGNVPAGEQVSVRATGTDQLTRGQVGTGRVVNGRYEIADLPTGQYRIEVINAPKGYTPTTIDPKQITESGLTANFKLTRDAGSIAGRITGAPADILDQVTVTVSGEGLNNKSVEVRRGQFGLQTLPTGNYSVTAKAPKDYSFDNNQTLQDKNASVAKNQQETVAFALTRDTGVIEGTISGGTASIDTVRVVGEGVNETVKVVDGKFRTRKLPTGNYTVTANEPAKHTLTGGGEVNVTKDGTAKTSFTLRQQTGSIAGNVSIKDWPQGLPAGTKVFVSGEDLPRTEVSLNNGAFRLQNLVIGDYQVEVQVPKGFAVAGQNPRPVKVEDGKTATPQIDVTVNTVSGTVKVVDGNGTAVPGAAVTVSGQGFTSHPLTTDAKGEIRLSGLNPGSYEVKVAGKNGAYADAQSTLKAEVHTGGRAVVQVKALNNISGVVIDDLGNPVEGAVVLVNGVEIDDPTNSAGEFDAGNRKPGKYQVQVKGTKTYGASQEQTVEVVAGKPTKSTRLNVALVKGSINVELDPAINPASVKITGGPKGVSAKTGMNSVYPGTYTVSVATPDGYAVIPAQQVAVGAGETKTVKFGASANAVEVSAKVVDDLGRAVAGATVKFGNQQVKTDSDGVARTSLKPGTYPVTAPESGTHQEAEPKTLSFKAGEKPEQVQLTQKVIRGDVRATVSGNGSVEKLTIAGGDLKQPQDLRRVGGAFVLDNLVPGDYTLTATALAGHSVTSKKTVPVTVKPGETATASFTVTAPTPATSTKPTPTTSVKPTSTTSTPKPTPTTTAPKPSPKPSPTRTSTTPMTTSTTQAPTPDVFSWDELKVAPGEVKVVAPKRETTNNQDKPVTFEAVEVVQKAENGTAKKVVVDQSWLQVEENGTVVAKPPAGTAPGVYELKIKASTSDAEAEAETVTIVVTETVPMNQRYTVKPYEVAVPAGTTGRAGTPRAEVKDGSFTYADRALPAGTTFKTDFPGANVDKKTGRVTYNPPADAKPGRVDIPVTVIFPDGSTDTFTTTFVVGEPLLAVKHPLRYARTSQAPAGQVATAEPAGTFPKGTTFALRSATNEDGATARGNDLNGWLVSVDPLTGKVRAIAPDANAAPLTVPVVAIFTDGSSHEYEVTFHAAPAAERHLQYSTARAARGETVALTLAKAPKDASFTVLGDATDFATINPSTGALSVTVPGDAAIGQELAIRVGATHPDGLAEETEARVFVIGDVHKYTPVFDSVNTEVGESAAVTRPRNVPAGTRFEIPKDYKKPGWTVKINEETGEVTARADSSVGPGERIDVPVNVIYPDGSSEQVAVGVGAVEKQEAPAPTDEGSSIGKAWIAIVLGVLAAIGGVGAALFMNQDEVRRLMAQFGF